MGFKGHKNLLEKISLEDYKGMAHHRHEIVQKGLDKIKSDPKFF